MQNLWNSACFCRRRRSPLRSCSACRRPMPSRASSSGWARTSPSRCCRSASRRRCWCCCRCRSISSNLGLNDTYIGLIWVYQLIALPLILWIVRGYFEDIRPDIEHAYRIAGHSWFAHLHAGSPFRWPVPGIAAAGLLAFIFCWNNFVFALILASADKQPVTVGALAFVTASGISVRPDRGGHRAVDHADAGAGALRAALSGRGPVARRGERLRRWHRSNSTALSKSFKTGDVLERRLADGRRGRDRRASSAPPAPARPCSCA